MFVSGDIKKVRKALNLAKTKKRTVGFVPTMGALHAGHMSLVKAARNQCEFLVVSLFVNPIQFSPSGDDFREYPRNFRGDKKLLQAQGVDLVFNPSIKTIYPDGFSTVVEEHDLSNNLCGLSRPGHFKGVCTVISKLLNVVQPDIMYLGRKDYQQAQIIRRLIRDLNFSTKVKVLSIIRDKDGLALSSRNRLLTFKERKDAVVLYRALKLAKKKIVEGQRNSAQVTQSIRKLIASVRSAKIDYVEIVETKSLKRVNKIRGRILIALAVYIGRTRLIDNIILDVK
ncbi:MAG: pantoate--beta-alanine ligase [Candidatus Omnitrophica bacterium]|nr:pantoate--beta-alanine ligase [Candidatus Omnitrophota bacterium]